jgi:hypothetical protein
MEAGMNIKPSLILREIVVGMLRAMTMAYAEETKTDSFDESWDGFHEKVEGFIDWLENESPLS